MAPPHAIAGRFPERTDLERTEALLNTGALQSAIFNSAKFSCIAKNVDLAGIPVIVVSGRDLRGNKERALAAGAKAFVQKPWDDDELLGRVARLLGEPDAYGQLDSVPIWDVDETVIPG